MEQAAQIIVGGLLQGSVFAVIALGLSLVYRVTGIINLAQGGFCILGALTLYTLETDYGWPVPLAIVVAVLITTLVGLAVGGTCFVPSLARLPNSSMLMLTAGLMTAIEGLALILWGSQPYAVPPFSGEQPVTLLGLRVPSQGLWIAGTSALIILATWYALARTATGKALLACAENPMAARLMGVDVRRLTLASFGVTALIGALGGIAVAPIMSFQFDTGRFFTNAGFIAVAIGGMSSLGGAVAGGLFLGVAEQLAAAYVSSLFATALSLGLLLVTLIWRPNGLFAARRQRRQDVREELRVQRTIIRFHGRGALVVGLVVLVGLALLPQLVGGGAMSSLAIALILFISVLGLDVLMGYTGQVNLGQSGFMAIGGYTAAILATNYGLPPLLGLVAGVAISLLCALVLSMVTLRLRGAYLALATLTFGLLVDALTVGLGDLTGGPSGLVGIPSFAIGGFGFDTPESMYYLVLGLGTVLVLALMGGMRSGFGRALQAIRTDQMAAAALGINVVRYKMAAFGLCAALGSIAGSLYAFDFHFLAPEMVGTARSFEMIAMLILGGEGTLVGGLIGALLITLLPTIFQPLAAYKIMAEGALLVLVFQFMPDGLLGTTMRQLSWLHLGRARPVSAPLAKEHVQ
jgi:branched-chain amino acid transport system permease protein